MKKFMVLFLLAISLFSGTNLTNAKTETPERIPAYRTTEDILITIINPRLNKIVEEQYGKRMIVNPLRVHDVAVMEKLISTKGRDKWDSWYEVRMSILVGDPSEKPKRDVIVLKIDAPYIGGPVRNIANDKIEGITVDLVKYYKG